MRLNPHPELLKVGDRVMSDHDRLRTRRCWTVLEIEEGAACESGRLVSVGYWRGKKVRTRVFRDPPLDALWLLPYGRKEE